MAARVAVIVPVREPAPFLDEALAGLGDDVAVVVVRDPDGRGPAWARNQGLAGLGEAVEWVGFCDADDVWRPGKLSAQLRAASSVDVVVGGAEIAGEDGVPTGEVWERPEFSMEALYSANPVLLSSVIVRRSVLSSVGGFAEDLPQAEDWDLWLRLLASGARFVSVPSARVMYRRHPGGLTRDVAALARAQIEVHRRHASAVPPAVAAAALAADHVALAEGLYRRRSWRAGRMALREGIRLGPVARSARIRGLVAAVPLLRSVLGRRPPY